MRFVEAQQEAEAVELVVPQRRPERLRGLNLGGGGVDEAAKLLLCAFGAGFGSQLQFFFGFEARELRERNFADGAVCIGGQPQPVEGSQNVGNA